jgi:lipoate-protein ligase A
MPVLDLTLPAVVANLALDEALFRALEGADATDPACPEVLRLWESPGLAVVAGRSGRIEEDVDALACAEAGVPILRRASGGGTVLLGPGCLCFSLLLSYTRRPFLRGVAESYGFVLGWIVLALGVSGLHRRGESDLALGERKVSGNAQLRGRHGLLHQGTLLHAFEPALLPRFLRLPRRQPAYRARRSHGDFVANLPSSGTALKTALALAWPPPEEHSSVRLARPARVADVY